MNLYLKIICLIIASASLLVAACAPPVMVVGAAAGVTMAKDRRTTGSFIDDQTLEIRIGSAINEIPGVGGNSHVAVTCYNKVVLLTGQTASPALRDQIAARTLEFEEVRRVHNEIELGESSTLAQRSADALVTARVKSALLGDVGFNAASIKVVTENNRVYLMGLLSRAEAESAARAVQQVRDVRAVITAFEFTD